MARCKGLQRCRWFTWICDTSQHTGQNSGLQLEALNCWKAELTARPLRSTGLLSRELWSTVLEVVLEQQRQATFNGEWDSGA